MGQTDQHSCFTADCFGGVVISGLLFRGTIPSSGASQPEKAQISVDGADQRYRYLRFDNLLTDEDGDDVRLKRGAHVTLPGIVMLG
jgi:hypothetical protein